MSRLPVAVVIPCFNDGATLMDAVQSAQAQCPDELVVVDDGSTDPRTLQCFTELEGRGVRVVHQDNQGLAAARMAGVEATTSALIMVLDSDDLLAPGALHAMASALSGNPELAVVWGDIERFGTAGYLRYPKARVLDPWRISHLNELVASTMVRRSALIEAGGWTLRTPFEDWDLWMAMAERGMRGRHVGITTLLYRVDEPRMYRGALKAYPHLVRTLKSRHPRLFRNRARLRKTANAGWLLKVAWTGIDVVPLPQRAKRYLYFGSLIACEPSRRRRKR